MISLRQFCVFAYFQYDKSNKISQSLLLLAFNSRNSLDVRFKIN